MNAPFTLGGYLLAGAVYLALTLLLLTRWRGRLQGGLLVLAALMAAVWGAGLAYATTTPNVTRLHLFLFETLQGGTWLVFQSMLLRGGISGPRHGILRNGGIWLPLTIIAAGLSIHYAGRAGWTEATVSIALKYGSLLISLYGLVLTEQVYRNARESQRSALKYLCLGVGGMFAYNLILYSNAILFDQISGPLWSARGYIFAMCAPLIALAAKQTPSWSGGIFVSRQIVFYTATLFGAGFYMVSMALIGYSIRIAGGNWGPAAQLVFIAAAFLVLFVFVLSQTVRSRLRVFISKHFFENKYDYREEWLRLIDTLTSDEDQMPLRKRGIKALADILNAPSGLLWLCSVENNSYDCVAGWNMPRAESIVPANDPLPRFLAGKQWVIDVAECQRHPDRYDSLVLTDRDMGVEQPGYVIPLFHDGLLGFVILHRSASPTELNYEDHDLLKTAGQQIASYLAQEQATEKLAESRQFEAFSKLTAYIMHDLKNVLAQQSLVVENAQKHKSNPEFIDDAIATIKGGLIRMRRVIENLQQGTVGRPLENIELGKLVLQAVSTCADRQPVPKADICDQQLWVRGDRERLLMAVYHGIRNAQDATLKDGHVDVMLESHAAECSIIISDNGKGMDERFIHEHLFRPFDSTKGTRGMGIGAYQMRETVRAIGGDISVTSQIGVGTRFILRLPQGKQVSALNIVQSAS